MTQSRQPKGVPTGGQFANGQRDEANANLSDQDSLVPGGIAIVCPQCEGTCEDSYGDVCHQCDGMGEVVAECVLTGADGENPDDCTTHDHEPIGPVSAHSRRIESLVRSVAEAEDAYGAAHDAMLRAHADLFDERVRQAFPDATAVRFETDDEDTGHVKPVAVLNESEEVIGSSDHDDDDAVDRFESEVVDESFAQYNHWRTHNAGAWGDGGFPPLRVYTRRLGQ